MVPLPFGAYSKRGIQRAGDYRYDADFNTFFPDAQNEECVFAWTKMWSDGDADMIFDLNCYGPLLVYLNGAEVWRSNIFTERDPTQYNRITLSLKDGWNHFVIRSKKTCGGFGWKFGSWIGKHPYAFMMPSPERSGQEGWLFTNPLPSDQNLLPAEGQSEADTGITWNPSPAWLKEDLEDGNCARIFGALTGKNGNCMDEDRTFRKRSYFTFRGPFRWSARPLRRCRGGVQWFVRRIRIITRNA